MIDNEEQELSTNVRNMVKLFLSESGVLILEDSLAPCWRNANYMFECKSLMLSEQTQNILESDEVNKARSICDEVISRIKPSHIYCLPEGYEHSKDSVTPAPIQAFSLYKLHNNKIRFGTI